jgi:tetratricopeptide (TPR) repeat protein
MKHPRILRDLLQSLLPSLCRSSQKGRLLELPRPEADYSRALERSAVKLRERQIALDRERAEAGSRFAELTRYPPQQQALVLYNDPCFHTWGMLEELLERSQAALSARQAEGERLAGLAVQLADRLDLAYYGESLLEDLRARAWSCIAEARRLRSDFAGAGEAFDRAHDHLRIGTGDALERALILDLEAGLRRCERRLDEAKRLLRKALETFVENGEDERAVLSLIRLADVYRADGELVRALALLQEAQRRIGAVPEPRLLLRLRHHQVQTLAAAGRLMEARGLLLKSRALYRLHPDASTQSHLRWLRGQIALGFAQMAEAEAELLGARQGFLGLESRYEASLVALDLAILYARQNRAAELREMAGRALEVFRALGLVPLAPEIRAAESFLRQAGEIEGARQELARAASAFE